MKKKLLAIALSTILTCTTFAGFSAQGSAATTPKTLDKVTLQLSWLPQSEFMGFYVADKKGYYKDAGIQINILPGGSNIIPEQQVSAGIADVGVNLTSSLMQYQSKGWNLQEISQLFQKSAMLFVSKKAAGIKSIKNLKGKKIGCWFGGNEYDLYALLTKAKLDRNKDVTLVQQDFTMDQFTSGKIDVAQAMSYNEYGLLLESGYKKTDLNVISVENEGVAMLEDCMFANTTWASKHSDLLVRFLKASLKGWKDACKDPAAAGKIVYNKDKSVSLKHQIYMAQEVAKLVTPNGFSSAKIGYMDPKALKRTSDLAVKYGLLKKPANLAKCINNTYWKKAIS